MYHLRSWKVRRSKRLYKLQAWDVWKCNWCYLPPCGYGQYQNATGKIACVHCPAGTYGSAMKATTKKEGCIECAAGLYQDEVGQLMCKVCKDGQFAVTQKKCRNWTICNVGTTYLSMEMNPMTACSHCSRGTYTVQRI